MPTTAAPWSLRYPVLTDTANPPRDLGYLAADTTAGLALVATPPSCRVALSASTPFAVGTNPIVWTVESFDKFPAGGSKMHSTSVNPERITIRTAGQYRISAMVLITEASGATSTIPVYLYKNAAAIGTNWLVLPPGLSATTTFAEEVQLAASDYLTLKVAPSAAASVRGDLDVHMIVTWVEA